MRVLLLNWRCPTNPQAGGAELLSLRVAERLVAWGHTVTWFAASYPRARPHEVINGVQVVRAGRQWSVHLRAAGWFARHGRRRFDLVVDEINTIPFFAHLYADCPAVAFINQLAREVWWYEAPLPLAALGYALEPLYLRAYRRQRVITISPSSAESLRALGLAGPIHLIPMATDFEPEPRLPPLEEKETGWTLMALGRVVPSKRIEHVLRALPALATQGCPARLWVVGAAHPGYQRRLEGLARTLGVDERVRFWGKVREDQKRDLLRRAHILVACSVREGWGLMVTEANRVGTPAVVYDVPGLRDSTQHGVTGVVCERPEPASLARAIGGLLRAPSIYASMREAAWAQASRLNWDETARAFLAAAEMAHSPARSPIQA
jgi:glycosyltransferase involved in cell wall biosynthesis